ncbi:uncharacterized protein LOC108908322 [Anoplophora glabripennis]|uniref:SERTA domain-containing protein n=1 Tax=Anoplophora glabripennis TaxID=217634 RepID=V5GC03_ANOGL|nr:uncharacterized protein LOC108908322 [Anoplophora glabripennis]XP_023310036.1 uncharacterized protein LOC108908322 [Anoplophora glabripennis]XP_023310037.1 uncharacterized protein LOC108908322 [Anoplophora glabripennis]XP_023310038.1 uncharacterized protein LOC108908322 [Anoplophora glabripennis]
MKSPSAATDDCDDIFGPPRTYPTGYSPPKSRLSMISPKYRQKEEQRKAWKISFNKLSKIDDKEECLCRWVMIRNVKKRLEQETMNETILKTQVSYPRYDNDNYLSLKSDFMFKNVTSYGDSHYYNSSEDSFVVEPDFDAKLAEEINEVNAKTMEAIGNFVEGNLGSSNLPSEEPAPENERFTSGKRSFDDLEDCDVQDVLSQLYMPPTPRMLTTIDDDEGEPTPKRIKMDLPPTEDSISVRLDKSSCDKSVSEFSVNSFLNNNVSSSEARLRYLSTQNESDSNPYSCGHASMFSELQNNVYHNLIASLET